MIKKRYDLHQSAAQNEEGTTGWLIRTLNGEMR